MTNALRQLFVFSEDIPRHSRLLLTKAPCTTLIPQDHARCRSLSANTMDHGEQAADCRSQSLTSAAGGFRGPATENNQSHRAHMQSKWRGASNALSAAQRIRSFTDLRVEVGGSFIAHDQLTFVRIDNPPPPPPTAALPSLPRACSLHPQAGSRLDVRCCDVPRRHCQNMTSGRTTHTAC